jgi:hypothetical protein
MVDKAEMFSITRIALSTTKPVEMVRDIRIAAQPYPRIEWEPWLIEPSRALAHAWRIHRYFLVSIRAATAQEE